MSKPFQPLEYGTSHRQRLPWFTLLGVMLALAAWGMFYLRVQVPGRERTVVLTGLAAFAVTAIGSCQDRGCGYRRLWRVLEVLGLLITLPWVVLGLAGLAALATGS